ncbi:hypothetical protein PSQ90_07305 [Devosia rhodophyticola]|uniref:LPS export ABC transporter periplasmic protein LptC n=1 Tax=Devosia rhodophyticola TaxID=3026423 RepID=A0ABY7Z295_9HYPH|nr:hypothetical protein [Devosia rhodophyticola]WDR07224.1 hypothetical protein PSQ90_07305 [Devosia rhodophyticola]
MSASTATRRDLYRRLASRNRVVARLRLLVPVAGIIIFAIIVGQIFISSLSARFGIGQVKLSSDSITIEQPEYSGRLDDGSHYRVNATSARATVAHPEIIELSGAALTVNRASGTTMEINAPLAQLDTLNQLIIIKNNALVEDSDGTVARLVNSVFDWSAQTLNSNGPVSVDYPDGTTVVSKGLLYDAKTALWSFTGATVTLPSTPGAAPK